MIALGKINMQLRAFFILCSVLIMGSHAANAADWDSLSPDAKLACKAVLCILGGKYDGECSDAVRKFQSIVMLKPWKTLQARKDFLNLCPGQEANVEKAANGFSAIENCVNRPSIETVTSQECTDYYRDNPDKKLVYLPPIFSTEYDRCFVGGVVVKSAIALTENARRHEIVQKCEDNLRQQKPEAAGG